LAAVQQSGRFGAFTLDSKNPIITNFREKPKGYGLDNAWINGGFFVVELAALDQITGDDCAWGKRPVRISCQFGEIVSIQAYRILAANGFLAGQEFSKSSILVKRFSVNIF
jgi:glucose-1-phosphate cytidylyltransferase